MSGDELTPEADRCANQPQLLPSICSPPADECIGDAAIAAPLVLARSGSRLTISSRGWLLVAGVGGGASIRSGTSAARVQSLGVAVALYTPLTGLGAWRSLEGGWWPGVG